MTIHDEILTIANKIANSGKKPTVALIKTKLSQTVPLPLLISALKTWQHDPEFISLSESKPQKNIKPREEADPLHHALSEELKEMKQEIVELKLLMRGFKKCCLPDLIPGQKTSQLI